MTPDTIAAIATPVGAGGIGVVRISGPNARAVLAGCFRAKHDLEARKLCYGDVVDSAGNLVDRCLAVFMPAPSTYTREDVAEIQCHGGSVCVHSVLQAVLAAGARPAHAGEFTKRAYLNGRIDLAEAESVMALISANCETARRAALRQMNGGVSAQIGAEADAVLHLLSTIEACDDFPEEIDEEASRDVIERGALDIADRLDKAGDPKRARYLSEGFTVVLSGRPNTGKSSIMNALLGKERAIVTDTPGTTRDVLEASFDLRGVRCNLCDTAGQRESDDLVERIGVELAVRYAAIADVVLLVLDGSAPLQEEDRALLQKADKRTILLLNKSDLPAILTPEDFPGMVAQPVCALTHSGVKALRELLSERAYSDETALVTLRHAELAQDAAALLRKAAQTARMPLCPLDFCAVDLQEALTRLYEITGQSVSEAVVDDIFAHFCVGK